MAVCIKALKMSMEGNFNKGSGGAWHGIAKRRIEKNDLNGASLAFENQAYYAATKYARANCYSNAGNVQIMRADYEQAATFFYKGLRILENDTTKIGYEKYLRIYTGLAIVNQFLKQEAKQLYYLRMGEQIARREKLDQLLLEFLLNTASYYEQRKQSDTAMRYLVEAEAICDKINDAEAKIDVLALRGSIYNNMHKYAEGITYHQAALNLAEKSKGYKREHNIIVTSYFVGNDLNLLGKFSQAEAIMVAALQKAYAAHDRHNILAAYVILANTYKAEGNYRKALACKDSIIAINDLLTGLEKATVIDQMDIKYKTAEKDKQIAQNQVIIAQQKNRIARKNILMLSATGGVVLLLLLSAMLYLQVRNRQKNADRDSKIALLKATVAGGDQERSRLARELHDGIGGMLSAAMMRFSTIHHENQDVIKTAAYGDTMRILSEMGDEIRKTAHNLMPDILMKQTLPEAVLAFCNSVQEAGVRKIDFQCYGWFDDLTQGHKLNLYRVIQELIKNVMAHADASHILVQLLRNEKKLMVSVEDNGKGFAVNEVKGGIGLHNIRTRVNSLDGHLIIESRPGKGTTVIIELELPETGMEERPADAQGVAIS